MTPNRPNQREPQGLKRVAARLATPLEVLGLLVVAALIVAGWVVILDGMPSA